MDNHTGIEDVKLITGSNSLNTSDFFSVLLEKTNCPVIYVGKDYRYKYVNTAYANWFGALDSEIIGQEIDSFLGEEIFSRVKAQMDLALLGQEVKFEDEIPYKNGSRFIEVVYAPDVDEAGNVNGFVATLKDITSKKETEKRLQAKQQELAQSTAHYEKLLTILPAAVYTTDNNGYITFYNEAAANMWGRHPVIGKEKWSGFLRIYKADGTTLIPFDQIPIALTLKEGINVAEELVVECANGSRKRILPNPEPLFDSEGNVTGTINMLIDITERRIAEEEKAKLAAIVESSDDAIISKTLDGIVSSWNHAAEKLFGYTEEEMIGQPITKIIPVDRLDEEPQILSRLRRGERVDHFETKRIAKNGSILDISLTISPVKDRNGKIIGASKIARNVTAQNEAAKLIYENEERFRMAVEATKIGTWEYSPRTGDLEWSAECKRIYDLAPDMAVNFEFFMEHVHPEDREYVKGEVNKAMDPGGDGSYDVEFRILRYTDKQPRWVRSQGKVFFEEQQLERFIGTVIDITKEKQEQKELEESVELFQAMAENVPAMIWMSGTDKFHDYFNKTWLDFTGHTIEEESNEGWLAGVHPDDVKRCIETYNQELKEQEGFYIEYRLRRHDGQYRWVADNTVPRYSPEGVFLGFISACIDIDDQKRFREKIQESELLFKTISNTSPAALWMTDKDGSDIFVSESWLKWTGRSFSDEISMGWRSAIHDEDKEKISSRFVECFEARKTFSAEFRLLSPQGNLRWCLTEGKPYFDINGFFAGYAGSVADITDLKKLEQRKDDFIKMASHELKTPITSINGYVQLLLNIYRESEGEALQLSRNTVKSSLTTIAKQVAKLTRLISELLDLSKIESGKLELHCTRFDLTEFVEEIVQDIRHTTSSHAIIVESHFDGKIFGDKDRIGQVLMNLLNNAIKYSPDADSVEVYVNGDNKMASIKVKDHGIGIDKKDFKNIFERFYRVEGKTEQTYPGFGIGLFIASEVVQRHNGSIEVSSEKANADALDGREKGSIFTVNLPLDFHQ